jgi:hypothetical protein
LMYRLAYRNFSDHQSWLVSHSVTAGSSVGERWYEFQAPEGSTGLSVYQQGTFAPDSSYRWMGSIAMDQNQDIALGYSLSSSSLFPSIDYTGRVPTDALGTMETEASIVAGTGSQTDTSNRWGDYTSMALDAADGCTFWYTNQYYMVTASFDWSTRLASFKFANCGSTTPDFSLSASPPSQTVVQGTGTSYTATVTSLNGFSSAVSLTVSGCPSNATCALNPTSVTPPANGSTNSTLSVTTTTNTQPGTYTLTVTGTSGSLVHSTSVTLVVTAAAQPDFSISASPTSTSVKRGNTAMYTVTLSPLNSFSGSVSLSVTGCPSRSTCSFNPNPVTVTSPNSSMSTYSVKTSRNTSTSTYTMTITGTSGSLVHSATVSLTVTR